MADKAVTRRLHIYVNGKEVERTLTNLRKEYVKAKAQLNRAPIGSKEWQDASKQVDRLGKELDHAKKEQLEFLEATKKTDKELKEGTESLDDYGQSLSNIFNGVRNGDFMAVKEGFEGMAGGIRGATKAAWGFIATPVGASIAILAGIAVAARHWINYNEAASKAIITTEQITGLTGQSADNARIRAQALADTFEGTEFEENLRTARVLAEQFGITLNEAFDTIEDGLIRGQAKNGEYFESLKEYSTFFAQAGFSAQEFKDIIETGYDLGIYNDKLPDALKEFDLSIREQTTATRDALVNAFGAPFTDDILERVREGETTTKEALQEISEEAQKQGLNLQQASQITADLFRSAGEDAGGAIKIFEAVGAASVKASEELTPLEESTKELAAANLELAKAQDEALKSDNYLAFTRDIEIFWTKIKTLFYNGISFITDTFHSIVDTVVVNIVGMTTTFQAFPTVVKNGIKEIVEDVKSVIGTFTGLGDVIENLLDFNFTGAKEAAVQFKENFSNAFNDTKESAKGVVNELLEIRKQSIAAAQASLDAQRMAKADAVREEQESQGSTSGNGGGGGSGSNSDSEDEVDKEAQKRIEKEKSIRNKVKEALEEYEKERELQEQLKKIEKDQRQEEEEVLRLEEKFEKLREDAAGETELLAALEEEKLLQIQLIRDKYAEERKEKEQKQQKELYDQQIKLQEKLIAAEDRLVTAKRNAAMTSISILRGFVGESTALGKALFAIQKGMAIASIIADSAKAISGITSAIALANAEAVAISPLTAGMPMVATNTAIGTKSILATKISAATQIASIVAEGIQGFKFGGYTGNINTGVYDSNGDAVTGVVHQDEYVIPKFVRQDPEVPQVIDYLENKRQEKLSGVPGSVTDSSSNIDTNAMYVFANAVNRLVDEGIFAKNIWNQRELDKFDKEYNKLQKTKQSAKINS